MNQKLVNILQNMQHYDASHLEEMTFGLAPR